ncbi:MAG: DUF333 domain-containing protein [Anaerolineaceae bacterium]|nr:DUF333 domain-containing protein [Anaerolineaceae bacterium]
MKRTVFFLILILLTLSLVCASCRKENGNGDDQDTQLANPASVYCEEQGGTVEMRADAEGNQYGVCVFSDGSECDEWEFFRGDCQPGG